MVVFSKMMSAASVGLSMWASVGWGYDTQFPMINFQDRDEKLEEIVLNLKFPHIPRKSLDKEKVELANLSIRELIREQLKYTRKLPSFAAFKKDFYVRRHGQDLLNKDQRMDLIHTHMARILREEYDNAKKKNDDAIKSQIKKYSEIQKKFEMQKGATQAVIVKCSCGNMYICGSKCVRCGSRSEEVNSELRNAGVPKGKYENKNIKEKKQILAEAEAEQLQCEAMKMDRAQKQKIRIEQLRQKSDQDLTKKEKKELESLLHKRQFETTRKRLVEEYSDKIKKARGRGDSDEVQKWQKVLKAVLEMGSRVV